MWLFLLMQISCSVLNKHEVVQDESTLDEGTLILCDHLVQPTSQPISQQFGDEFGKRMNQTNRPVIFDIGGIIFFLVGE